MSKSYFIPFIHIYLHNAIMSQNILSHLPDDLVVYILTAFTGKFKIRKGKLVKQIDPDDERYVMLSNRPTVEYMRWTGDDSVCGITYEVPLVEKKRISKGNPRLRKAYMKQIRLTSGNKMKHTWSIFYDIGNGLLFDSSHDRSIQY